MKQIVICIVISILSIIIPKQVFAVSNPLSVPNNRFGIHIVDPNDLDDASSLVNTSGGDWGYVTLVIPQNDRSKDKWQAIFDKMRRLHLIPIVRLATSLNGSSWSKPDEGGINNWVDFLNSLNWVVKNRYVVIFNEPNHADEWGGSLDPAGYAQILAKFSDKLKEKSPDFFVLPAGLDASAPNSSITMDESIYIQKMHESIPNIYDKIDGWVSHSYPNPGFSGSPNDTGRGTVRTYQWEKSFLYSLGLWHNFPIFITETGWPHKEGIFYRGNYVSQNTASVYIATSFQSVWTDNDIAAITPFVLNYQSYPFDNFSWKKPGQPSFYDMYYNTQSLTKISGHPNRITKLTLLGNPFPADLVTNSDYTFEALVKNDGQSIFDKKDGFYTKVIFGGPPELTADLRANIEYQEVIEPGNTGKIKINIHTSQNPGKFSLTLLLMEQGSPIISTKTDIILVKPPSLTFSVQSGVKKNTSARDFSLIIYDQNEIPVQVLHNLSVENNVGHIDSLRNVVVGKNYRIVIEKPYYLPRQEKLKFKEGNNNIKFRSLLPLDLDLDGKFTFYDYLIIISHPIFTFKLLF